MSSLKNSILTNIQSNVFGNATVVKYVDQFVFDLNETNYNLAVEALNAATNVSTEFVKKINKVSTARILAVLADGRSFYDSSKGSENTYANFKEDLIHPNGVTRASIREAMDSEAGVGAEIKLSNTTGSTESYVAVRAGESVNSIEYVIRMSFVVV